MKIGANTLIALSLLILGFNVANAQQYNTNDPYIQELIQYYRANTGDYETSDQQAMGLGAQLWCGHNPGVCEAALNPATYKQSGNTAGDTYSNILDIQHEGYMDRSNMTHEGHSNYVKGAVRGETTYINPNGGNMDLPVHADPNWNYTSPDGYPLHFDSATGTWYQSNGFGNWVPLQSY